MELRITLCEGTGSGPKQGRPSMLALMGARNRKGRDGKKNKFKIYQRIRLFRTLDFEGRSALQAQRKFSWVTAVLSKLYRY